MADPGYALHVALLARLKGLVTIPVWDAVPQGSPYPYVTIDTVQSTDNPYLTLRVSNRFVYLTVWSRDYGQAQAIETMGQISEIHETPLALSTGSVVSVRVERTLTAREQDGLTIKGHVTLRILTQH